MKTFHQVLGSYTVLFSSLLLATLLCFSCSKDDPDMSGEGEGENSNLSVDFDLPDGRIYNNCGVTFTDKSTGATTYEWDFGDGIKSAEESPVHSYSNPGNYTVTLMVTKDDDTQEKSEDIQVYQLNTFRKSFGDDQGWEFGRSVALDNDGNYIVVGAGTMNSNADRILWTKLSPEGNVLNEKMHGGPDAESVASMVKAEDGGFVVGHTTTNYGNSRDFGITKLSNDGDLIWSNGFPTGFDEAESVNDIINTQDNGYLIVGTTASNTSGSDDGLIMKVDDSGNLVWSKKYGSTGFDGLFGAYALSNGGYIISGFSILEGSNYADFWLVKVDDNGAKQWDKFYGTSEWDEARSAIIETADGGYILGGVSFVNDQDGISLIYKLDQNGNIQWQKEINDTNNTDWAESIVKAQDGGYIICGHSDSDAYLLKIDENGNKVWAKTYTGSSYFDSFQNIAALDECSYVAIGMASRFSPNGPNNYLVRVDLDGNAQ